MNFLLVGPNKDISRAIDLYFKKKGFVVTSLHNYDEILDYIDHINLYQFNVFIFDVTHEDDRAFELMEYLKIINIERPIIFLTRVRNMTLLTKVFAMGGEDLLYIPFEMKELELRIMKALRKQIIQDEIKLDDDYSYIITEHAMTKGHTYIDLTQKQQQLLYLFMTHSNQLVSYEMIQHYVYGNKAFSNNAVATHIRDIKKKIPNIPIKAVKGIGYILQLGRGKKKEI